VRASHNTTTRGGSSRGNGEGALPSADRTQLTTVLVPSQGWGVALLRAIGSVENNVRTSGAPQLRSGWCGTVSRA
jgi:hypothetical protein